MSIPCILGFGGAHIDKRGVMEDDYIFGASIPGRMIEEPGGGVLNALRTARQFQMKCALLSARGGDAAGEMVADALIKADITDLSAVFLDRATASYTALLTTNGDVIAALADMKIYEKALPRLISRRKTRDAVNISDAILLDANIPGDSIVRLVKLCTGKPIFALSISPAKAVRLLPILDRLSCLFLNKREASAILTLDNTAHVNDSQYLALELAKIGLKSSVITDGPHDVCVAQGSNITMITPPKPEHVVDVTGAGDALAGATIAALLKGLSLQEAVGFGLAAAAQTVETKHTCADFSNLDRFNQLRSQLNT